MSFFTQIFLVLTWSSEGPPSTPLGDFILIFIPEEFYIPRGRDWPKEKPTWSWSGGHWIHHKWCMRISMNNSSHNIPCDFYNLVSWRRLWEPLQKANYFSSKKVSFDMTFYLVHHHGRSIHTRAYHGRPHCCWYVCLTPDWEDGWAYTFALIGGHHVERIAHGSSSTSSRCPNTRFTTSATKDIYSPKMHQLRQGVWIKWRGTTQASFS
jgi:hypothetical protein